MKTAFSKPCEELEEANPLRQKLACCFAWFQLNRSFEKMSLSIVVVDF